MVGSNKTEHTVRISELPAMTWYANDTIADFANTAIAWAKADSAHIEA
jgi:hypothetical protein